jgi:hypothetical protein
MNGKIDFHNNYKPISEIQDKGYNSPSIILKMLQKIYSKFLYL